MKSTMFLVTLVVAFFGNLNAQGAVTAAPQEPKSVRERERLAFLESWSDGHATVLIAGPPGAPARRVVTDTKTVFYANGVVTLPLALMSVQGDSYVVAGGQSFHVVREADVLTCLVSSGGFYLGEGLYRSPRPAAGASAPLIGFLASVSDAHLQGWSRRRTRINLTRGVPNAFWTAHGGFDSQAGDPEVIDMDLTGDSLRLLLAGAGGKMRATFWLDIARKVLTRTEMDGKVVFAEK